MRLIRSCNVLYYCARRLDDFDLSPGKKKAKMAVSSTSFCGSAAVLATSRNLARPVESTQPRCAALADVEDLSDSRHLLSWPGHAKMTTLNGPTGRPSATLIYLRYRRLTTSGYHPIVTPLLCTPWPYLIFRLGFGAPSPMFYVHGAPTC